MTTSTAPSGQPAPSRRWLARAALAAAALAVVAMVAAAGFKTIPLLLVIIAGAALAVVGVWLYLSHHGTVRFLGAALAVASLVTALALEVAHSLLWVVIVCAALLVGSFAAARAALRPSAPASGPLQSDTPPPLHAFFIMNPRSGGGKV